MAVATGRVPIGELARRTKFSPDTIRYYERIRLMPDVERTSGGHRFYDSKHVTRLAFIRRSRDLGLSLNQVRELVGGIEDKRCGCPQVRELLMERAQRIRTKIKELQRIEGKLKTMIDGCGEAELTNCPAIEAMLAGEEPMPGNRCCRRG